jgi:hypothetical protein
MGMKMFSLPWGGVAQWTLHPPQEQKTRVRIPPGYTVFREDITVLFITL